MKAAEEKNRRGMDASLEAGEEGGGEDYGDLLESVSSWRRAEGENNFQMHRDRIVYVHNKITNHNFLSHTEEQAARESRAG